MRRVATALVAMAALAGACGGDPSEPVSIEKAPIGEPRSYEAQSTWEFADLADWVTYADHVSVVEIVGEERGHLVGVGDAPIEGRVPVTWTAKVIETVWRSPAFPVPGEVRFAGMGYQLSDGVLHPLVGRHELQIDVGARFVAGFARGHDGEVFPWTSDSLLSVDDDAVVHAPADPGAGAAQADGMPLDRLADTLAKLPPYAKAVPYMAKPGELRYLLSHGWTPPKA